jgi:DNA-binding NarL/FixJ family response regulator
MRQSKQLTIFIVEDNQIFTLYIDALLKQQFNFKISTYATGEGCVKDLGLQPDIIILDYMLEGMDGLQVLKTAKLLTPETKVILLTGQKDLKTAVQLMKEGADEYIIKDNEAPANLVAAILRIANVKKKRWGIF